MFDAFHIPSGWLHFSQGSGAVAGLFDRPAEAPGTRVAMQIDNLSRRTTREVFNDYAAPEEFSFAKTLVPVAPARSEGDKLVSRSQSKRLTLRLERFQTVVLDFAGIDNIGQGFADEVFRVFQAAHPGTALVHIHITPAVEGMVQRARGLLRSG